MKNTIITLLALTALGTSTLFANDMATMAKDAAITKAKSAAKDTVVKEVAKNTPASEEMVKKVADKVSPEASAKDKVKSAVAQKLINP